MATAANGVAKEGAAADATDGAAAAAADASNAPLRT